MTTEETTQDCGCDDTPPKSECTDCDTEFIAKLKCKAAGVAAEAEFNAKYQQEVSDAEKEFNAICTAYRKTRTDVTLKVNDMRHETKRAIERIRCMIKQRRVVECLDEAWCEVERELECCTKDGGCCVESKECEFPIPEKPDCPKDEDWDDTLKALIAKYTDHTEKAKGCFNSLKKESADLADRVTKRKADLDAILGKLNANDPTTDLKRLYASALVLKYRLTKKVIWNGFDEPKDFVDCLCKALTCWTEGSAQIAVLKNLLAVYECHEQADKDRCTYVKEHTEDVILAVYEKKCCPDPCPPPEEECDDEDDSDDEKPGCGCDCHNQESRKPVRSAD